MADKIPLVAVVGPTASGKTGLGIAIAKHYGGEVVSADSMQIYRTKAHIGRNGRGSPPPCRFLGPG